MAWPVRAAEYAYVKVGNPDQTGGFGYALNNSGRVATTSLVRSFLFGDNSYSSYVEITNVNVAATTPGMVAQGMNDLGEVVGRFRTNGAPANQTRGFIRRNNGTFEVYDAPGVASTSISDNNGFGHFVGETRSDLTAFGQVRGFVNSNGFFSEIHFPSATLTRAYGINNGGDIVGQYQREDGVNHAFLLSNGSYTEIVPTSAPGGLISALATSISDNGKIVGTYRDSANATKIWVRLADGTFRYPTLPGSGWAINDAGQISGSFLDATNANARTPFVAAPPINFGALTNAAGLYSLGHGDVRAYYEGGQLKLRYQLDYNSVVNGGAVGGPLTGPVSFPLNEIVVAVPDITLPMPDPADLPAYAFIGAAAGDPLYYVPEVQEDDRPWLGFSSEELSLGQWEGDALQLNLVSVFGPAGAHLSMFSTDGVGEPLVHFATSNGIDAGDRYAYLSGGGSTPGLRVSTHAHVTWMFTKPGHYE